MKEQPINNFGKLHQIWAACGKDELHPVFKYVFFENGFAYASDGHILVRIPIGSMSYFNDEDNVRLNGHGIYGPAMKLVTDLGILKMEDCKIKNSKGEEEDGLCLVGFMEDCEVRVTLTNHSQQKPPKFDEVFNITGERTPIKRIGVSQKYLSRLTKALGTEKIKMQFVGESKQIRVTPIDDLNASEGLIMPLIVSGTLEGFE